MRRGSVARVLALVTTCSVCAPAAAAPQWNVSAVTGVCGQGADGELWQSTCWYNGLRGDVIFGRSRNADIGVGPYLELNTAGFDDLRPGGGLTLHLPVHPFFPVLLSAGGYARGHDGWEPGVEGWLFFGSRSYNFHSSYGIAGGLLLGYQHGLGDSRENALVIAAQIDGLVLALPFIALFELVRGSPDE